MASGETILRAWTVSDGESYGIYRVGEREISQPMKESLGSEASDPATVLRNDEAL
jgi:hypothetical protein